jgi:phenylpropionate dioxygenase-like ring-hydroxylating dioxygenase large terminal subunit
MVTEVLKNVWYAVGLSSEVQTSQLKAFVLNGEPLVLTRRRSGEIFGLRDICPHRGIPLSYGKVVNDQVECPYHGWTFDQDGICTEIPSLCEGQSFDCRKIKVKSYPVAEKYGLIWVFLGEPSLATLPSDGPQLPHLETLPEQAIPDVVEEALFPCHIDHAVIGLMDPAHGPYVHQSWFWRSSKSSYEKRKTFAPVPFGFQMVRHLPSKNSKAYQIFGGQPTTEITFSLPGVRVEHIKIGQRNVYNLTALCPVNEKETRVLSLLYWEGFWLSLMQPFIQVFAHRFLYQDLEAVTKQQQGLQYDPSLMLIKDADTQAKWYYALKAEWKNHQLEAREFRNPVTKTELRWRS